jgi:hypothetical protein
MPISRRSPATLRASDEKLDITRLNLLASVEILFAMESSTATVVLGNSIHPYILLAGLIIKMKLADHRIEIKS